MWDDDIMAICLIRCCIWGQNFQCFRNDGNSLGCQTELNKLIYRPDRYMYVCHLYVIYIYMYVCTRYSHVKPAAKLLQNWPKFMEGNELTANVPRQSTAPFNVKRSAFQNWFPNPPPTCPSSLLAPLPCWHYNSQFSFSFSVWILSKSSWGV